MTMKDVDSPQRHQGTSQDLNLFKSVRVDEVLVLPRSKENLYVEGSTEEFIDLLPDFQPISKRREDRYPPKLRGTLRRLEERFYVDIATQRDGTYMGHRKVTAVVRGTDDQDDQPLEGTCVEWRCTEGSDELRFVDANDQLQQELTRSSAPKTDENGMVEVTVAHPSQSVAPGTGLLQNKVTIEARVEGATSTVELLLTRNAAVRRLDDLARRDEEYGDLIWVYQPDETVFSNPGIEELQEVLNEVVARHRGIKNYDWVPLDGIFGDKTRGALKQYLDRFAEIGAEKDSPYPYNLSDVGESDRKIGISKHLKEYIRAEYAPFDPEDEPGWIVDRRLLLGEEWDTTPAEIDGLLELKEGVVDRLKEEMVRVAEDYINCDTFWLHRPMHRPHEETDDSVFRVTDDSVKVKRERDHNSDTKATVCGGDLLDFVTIDPVAVPEWCRVKLPDEGVEGWVPITCGYVVKNHQQHPENAGTYGRPGMAYSYGGKDLPDEYTDKLQNNPYAPPEDGDGNQRRIAHWSEYAEGNKVGRPRGELIVDLKGEDIINISAGTQGSTISYKFKDGEIVNLTDIKSDLKKNLILANLDEARAEDRYFLRTTPQYTGCDCSGFVQNCITQATFDGEKRIVPSEIVPTSSKNTTWFENPDDAPPKWQDPARTVLWPKSASEHWVRRGDYMVSENHIVWVAEEDPDMIENGKPVNIFDIYNLYGCDFRYGQTKKGRIYDRNRFLRKALRMPFYWWGVDRFDIRIGKLYIWH